MAKVITGVPLSGRPLSGLGLGEEEDQQTPQFAMRVDKFVESFTDPDGSGSITPLDIITFRYNVRNTGTDPLTNVSLNDGLFGLSSFSCNLPEPVPSLGPGEVLSCTATYQVTETDAVAGNVTNTAVSDCNELPPVQRTVVTPVNPAPTYAMTLAKTMLSYEDNDGSMNVSPGDVLTYQYVAENTGDTRIENVTITDDLVGLSAIVCTPPQGSTLQPGEQMTGTATYTVLQADADAGSITNTGTVDGDQLAVPVTNQHTETVFQGPMPSWTFEKTMPSYEDNDSSGDVTEGDELSYRYLVTSTGATTLTNVQITDPLPGLSALSCNVPQPATLTQGQTLDCTATYTVTNADAVAGQVSNTATASCDQLPNEQDTHVEPVTPPVTGNTYYTLSLTDPASNGTAIRGIDNPVYSWGADNTARFVAINDNTIQPRCGRLLGPTKVIDGYTIYPAYRPWMEGMDLTLGDKVWTTNQDLQGCKILELAIASKTLGGRHEYDPGEWTVIDDYEPWLGILFQPRLDHLIASPAEPMNWTFDDGGGVGTRNAGTYDLIEGFTQTSIMSSPGNANVFTETNDLNATAGERVGIIVLLRRVAGSDPIKIAWTDTSSSQVFLMPDGSLFVDQFLYDSTLRWLDDGWVYIGLSFTAQTSATTRVQVYASEVGGGAGTVEVKAINFVRDTVEPYMVVPYQGVSPGDAGLQLGTPAQWTGDGYLTESQTLLSFKSRDFSAYSLPIALFQMDLSPASGTIRRHNAANEVRTTMASSAANTPYDYEDGACTYEINYTDQLVPDVETSAVAPGTATRTRSAEFRTPQTRASQVTIFDSGGSPDIFVMRFFAVWMSRDNFDFEAEFGPGSF